MLLFAFIRSLPKERRAVARGRTLELLCRRRDVFGDVGEGSKEAGMCLGLS